MRGHKERMQLACVTKQIVATSRIMKSIESGWSCSGVLSLLNDKLLRRTKRRQNSRESLSLLGLIWSKCVIHSSH